MNRRWRLGVVGGVLEQLRQRGSDEPRIEANETLRLDINSHLSAGQRVRGAGASGLDDLRGIDPAGSLRNRSGIDPRHIENVLK